MPNVTLDPTDRRSQKWRLVLVPLLLWAALFPPNGQGQTPTATLTDETFYFSVEVPAGWDVERVESSSLRLVANSPGGEVSVAFYGLTAEGTVDLAKLADSDRAMFPQLGEELDTATVRSGLFVKGYHKTYAPNRGGLRAQARFWASGTYGYVAVAWSSDEDFSAATPVLDSFEEHVPVSANLSNAPLGGRLLRWLKGLGIVAAICVVAGLLGWTGVIAREGLERGKALVRVGAQIRSQGQAPNAKWQQERRKARLSLWLPVIGWCLVYAGLFAVMPLKDFGYSFVFLIPPALGFFGMFLVPSVD